jgi:hypothetical protein
MGGHRANQGLETELGTCEPGGLRVVGPLQPILRERDRIRPTMQFRGATKGANEVQELFVEIGHRYWTHCKSRDPPICGGADDDVIDQVQLHLHAPRTVGNERAREAAH